MNASLRAAVCCIGIVVGGGVVDSASAAVGKTAGSYTVSNTGAAVYSIPIWEPPGVRGLQPSLAIVYNSQSGDGIMGPGWSLAGLSAISRCNRTYAQDTAPAAVTLTYADAFCLDGQRLRITNAGFASYGLDSTTYQTEIANFSNVTAHGATGNGPTYFTVQGKDGLTYEYGNTGDSRVTPSTGVTTAYTWLLNKVTDRAGNKYTVSYGTGAAGSVGIGVPQTISYTATAANPSTYGYTITFAYGTKVSQAPSTNDPAIVGYVSGTQVVNTNLLLSISIANSGTLVRKYSFAYGAAPTTTRARLTSVTECGGSAGTDCMSPTTIGYQDGTTGIQTSPFSAPITRLSAPRDIDGDGREDLVTIASASFSEAVAFSGASGYGTPVTVAALDFSDPPEINMQLVGDVGGFGRADILIPQHGAWSRYSWNGSSFSSQSLGVSLPANATGATLMDVNGDGRPDLVVATSTSSSLTSVVSALVYFNTSSGGSVSFNSTASVAYSATVGCGTSSVQPCQYQIRTSAEIGSGARASDFNGDGLSDLALTWIVPVSGGQVQHGVDYLISNGSAFTRTTGFTFNDTVSSLNQVVGFSNFNDDACTDVVTAHSVRLAACNGSPGSTITLASGTAVATLDWDGDGHTDVLVQNGSNFGVYLSTTTGASSLISTSIPVPTGVAAVTYVFDWNGDGLQDLGTYDGNSGASNVYAHNGAGTPPDLVTSITDGYNNNFSPSYVSIAQSNYTRYFDGAWPDIDYVGPTYVVSQYSASNGINGTYTKSFQYYGAHVNLQGRGFDGFFAKASTDNRNNFPNYQYYRRDFPYTGAVSEDDLYQANGTTFISSTVNTFALVTLDSTTNNQRYFPKPSQSVRNQYEYSGTLNGNLITKTTTTYTFDNSGNATDIKRDVLDQDATSPFNGLTWTTEVVNSIAPNTANWCLGLPTQTTTTETIPGSSRVHTTAFTPDYAACRITQQVVEPSSTTLKVTTNFEFDTAACGNVSAVEVIGKNADGTDMAHRRTTFGYGSRCQLAESVTNVLNATTSFTTSIAYNYDFGLPSSQTDPNGLVASWTYDTFGRRAHESRPDNTSTDYAWAVYGGTDPYIHTFTSATNKDTVGGTISIDFTYFDRFERLSRKATHTLSGFSLVARHYDARGNVSEESVPYDNAGSPTWWKRYSYDLLNRATRGELSDNPGATVDRFSTISYAGRTASLTDPLGNTSVRVFDVAGQLRQLTDPSPGGITQYSYAFENGGILAATITDPSSNQFINRSDLLGHKTRTDDPDMGVWVYENDSLGDPTKQTDAKSQITTFAYDAFARMTSRVEAEGTTTWTYGTSATSHNIGQLQSVSSPGGYAEAYVYDGSGRTQTVTYTEDTTYQYDYAYNSKGLLDTLTYPVSTSSYRLQLKYDYTGGYLSQIKNNDTSQTVFWQLNGVDPRFNPTDETLGNGVHVISGFDPMTGLIQTRQSGNSPSTTNLQNLDYQWDKNGNFHQRHDGNRSLTEIFSYDSLNRLTGSTLNGLANYTETFDVLGNILTAQLDGASANTQDFTTAQPGCPTYTYSQPHALRKTTQGSSSISYCYDANGNNTSHSAGGTTAWTSFNQPSTISQFGGSSQFSYDAAHQRWKHVATFSSGTETTIYVGKLLEKVTVPSGTAYRHFIPAGNNTVLYTRWSGGSNPVYYATLDHLGSTDTVTDATGTVVVNESFAALGSRRRATDWKLSPSTTDLNAMANITRRGFTGHEMMDDIFEINMNGRVNSGSRFSSPDPFIQDPGNSQSLNRYSYVMNNPLSATDPSGFKIRYWIRRGYTVETDGEVIPSPDVYEFFDDGTQDGGGGTGGGDTGGGGGGGGGGGSGTAGAGSGDGGGAHSPPYANGDRYDQPDPKSTACWRPFGSGDSFASEYFSRLANFVADLLDSSKISGEIGLQVKGTVSVGLLNAQAAFGAVNVTLGTSLAGNVDLNVRVPTPDSSVFGEVSGGLGNVKVGVARDSVVDGISVRRGPYEDFEEGFFLKPRYKSSSQWGKISAHLQLIVGASAEVDFGKVGSAFSCALNLGP